ncbi:L,D-transpeptidase [Salinarimonas soli]|uniref:L,D-transpeptidase n=1 Tax=Salinarimonas soli TaxID=1638099 RepID=A0A5B2VD96_9HYPH|nr:L,D-transpeptidase [Salinarimonas soli]KAA2237041.1 L,D-transpeptidase [Salinarimonas soli]
MRHVALTLAALVGAALVASPAAAYEIDSLTGQSLMGWGGTRTIAALPGPEVYRPQASAVARQVVRFDGGHAPGTVVVSTSQRRLYYVLGNGQAVQYGVGVGRPGFTWSGSMHVSMKREWPDWRPPAQMLKRRPDLPRHMKGGVDNPLGARAMYLGSSIYRIHGSNEPETIGQAVSSGCIRMTNDDVVDLYNRVRVGARVVVQR